MRFVGSHSQIHYDNFHNRLSADFPSRVLLFTEVLPWSLTGPQPEGGNRAIALPRNFSKHLYLLGISTSYINLPPKKISVGCGPGL